MKLNCAVFYALLSMVVQQAAADNSACTQNELTVAGSTTVYPVAVEWAYGYKTNCTESNVTVAWELGGSSVGAKRVCGDPSYAPAQIGTMSRTFNPREAALQSDGYTYNCLIGDTTRSVAQFVAFYDAVVLIVDSNDTSVTSCIEKLGCLTSDQIRWMYSNYTEAELIATGWNASSLSNSDGSDATHLWSELNATCPAIEIAIAGTDTVGRLSGEAEFFLKSYIPKYPVEPLRSSYVSIIDHDAINLHVLETKGAIAFNSYHAAQAGTPKTMFVPIKSPSGTCVTATKETVQSLTYLPLGRQTFMSVLTSDCTALLDGLSYIKYAYSPNGQEDIADTYGIPLTATDLASGAMKIETLRAGCARLF